LVVFLFFIKSNIKHSKVNFQWLIRWTELFSLQVHRFSAFCTDLHYFTFSLFALRW